MGRSALALAVAAGLLVGEASLLIAGAVSGIPAWQPHSRYRSDSEHYQTIAERGYQLRHCRESDNHGDPKEWCGNASWFPGYPGLVALVQRAGLPFDAAGVLVALACEALLLALVLPEVLRGRTLSQAAPVLILVALFPGFVFRHAIFPISLYLLAMMAFLQLLHEEKWLLAGAAAALAALAYSTGFLCAGVAGLWALRPGATLRQRQGALLAAALGGCGTLAALGMQWLATGAPDAFFLAQSRYAHGLSNPLDTWLARLKPLVNPRFREPGALWRAMQTALAGALVIGSLTVYWRRYRSDPRRSLPALAAMVLFVFPLLVGGQLSLHRAEATLLPAALLAPDLPRAMQWALAAGAVILAIPMGELFLRLQLI